MRSLENLKVQFQESGLSDAARFFEKHLSHEQYAEYRRQIKIEAVSESLAIIPATIARFEPHPYRSLGAEYGSASPFALREETLARLLRAESQLKAKGAGYALKVFDAFRPISVQEFMIQHEFRKLADLRGLNLESLDQGQARALMTEVLEFWARPSRDPAFPPPHSTGAAVDLTLIDSQGRELAMGTRIDQIDPRSLPSAFEAATDETEIAYHQNRLILVEAMHAAGFRRLPYEWWHFSYGDQAWALLEYLEGRLDNPRAIYGAVHTELE